MTSMERKHELEMIRWKITSMMQAYYKDAEEYVQYEMTQVREITHEAILKYEFYYDVTLLLERLIERLEYMSMFEQLHDTCEDILKDCRALLSDIQGD